MHTNLKACKKATFTNRLLLAITLWQWTVGTSPYKGCAAILHDFLDLHLFTSYTLHFLTIDPLLKQPSTTWLIQDCSCFQNRIINIPVNSQTIRELGSKIPDWLSAFWCRMVLNNRHDQKQKQEEKEGKNAYTPTATWKLFTIKVTAKRLCRIRDLSW